MIFPLIQDFADALAAMPTAHPRHRILTLLDEALRRDVHFIDRHPTKAWFATVHSPPFADETAFTTKMVGCQPSA